MRGKIQTQKKKAGTECFIQKQTFKSEVLRFDRVQVVSIMVQLWSVSLKSHRNPSGNAAEHSEFLFKETI